MSEPSLQKRPKKGFQRIYTPVSMVIFALMIVGIAAHLVWKNSGSNEWKLVRDKDGVKIWTMKTPGATLLRFKGQARVKSSLRSAVFFVRGDSTTYSDFGSKDFKIIDRVDSPERFQVYYAYKVELPMNLGTKQVVMYIYYSQDPITKKVQVNVMAAPNKIPPEKNISRVNHLNDIWDLTPLPNGEVDIEVYADIDLGEPFPYYIMNVAVLEDFSKNLKLMTKLLQTEKYQNAKINYIKELDEK